MKDMNNFLMRTQRFLVNFSIDIIDAFAFGKNQYPYS